ncbi:macrophage colony-stimulating factor 1a isoform X1 [Conger conger]|uniref:macrophage colony-stimulating factor 1a isoform X1 n=1 Tax=Conger conger TaxID=82655 RepID=UPI002A5A5706|nr:macrophage colony-stimulating factor 1a isoform X1 [Conger conger]
MNTHKQSHTFCKAKAWRQCFSLMMCFHVVLGDVPGPCKHSVTKEHLQNIQGLIDNQLQNDCSIAYTFMERQSLSKVCYVKAAFPQILELLKAHFQYSPSSDNYRYVSTLKMLVLNIYSHKCIPEINEEIEDDPVRFAKEYSSSRREAVGKIKKVLQLYMELMTENNKPVDWNCEEEYAEDYPELTTALAKSTGAPDCHCSCPTLGYGDSEQVSLPDTSQWDDLRQPSYLQSYSAPPDELTRPPSGIINPWAYVPVNPVYDRHHRQEEADSYTSSVRKEEKEVVNRDISSSQFPTFPGATPGSTASLDEKDSGPKEPSTSEHRVNLDSVLGAPGTSEPWDASQQSTPSVESTQGTGAFVSRIVSRSDTMDAPAFIQSQTQSTISALPKGQSSQLDSIHVIVSLPRESARSPTTPAMAREVPVRSTPTKPEETTAVLLAKRSLGPSMEGPQSSLGTENQPIQNWILSLENSPSASEISQGRQKTSGTIGTALLPTAEDASRAVSGLSVREFDPLVPTPAQKPEWTPIRTTDEKVESTGPTSGITADLLDSDSDRDSGKAFRNGTRGGSHISYKIAFITASVCGGLLLLITLYCFRKQKKLKALLHSSKVKENQRLTSDSKDIEMQDYEITEQSCLDST